MKTFVTAILMTFVLTLIFGVAYPLVVTGLAQVIFPEQANGSLIKNATGEIVGSKLIGQNFTGAEYFHPRLSAAGANGYDAAASGGSNLGPTSKKLIERIGGDAEKIQAENPAQKVPVDLVTTSASGLDPHISPEAAAFQISRIARARNVGEAELQTLVARFTEGRQFGFFGEPRVNVLLLNMELDKK